MYTHTRGAEYYQMDTYCIVVGRRVYDGFRSDRVIYYRYRLRTGPTPDSAGFSRPGTSRNRAGAAASSKRYRTSCVSRSRERKNDAGNNNYCAHAVRFWRRSRETVYYDSVCNTHVVATSGIAFACLRGVRSENTSSPDPRQRGTVDVREGRFSRVQTHHRIGWFKFWTDL